MEEETEAQNLLGAWPRSHNYWVVELRAAIYPFISFFLLYHCSFIFHKVSVISRPSETPKITILISKSRAWFLSGPSYFCEPYIKFRNRTLGRNFQMAENLPSSVIKPFENVTLWWSRWLINCTISIISNGATLILSKFREIWHADMRFCEVW